jgi:transcriptional regulator with XRE-family HTH domain
MADLPTDTFAQRLVWLRTVADISQADLGELAGLTAAGVGRIERGERTQLFASTVASIAKVFGVSIDWLWDGKGLEPSADGVRAMVAWSRKQQA